MGKGDQRTLVDEVKKGDKPIYIAASRRHLISRLRRQLPRQGEAKNAFKLQFTARFPAAERD